jgi:predicted nucleic acid-binding Zn ribbon protein
VPTDEPRPSRGEDGNPPAVAPAPRDPRRSQRSAEPSEAPTRGSAPGAGNSAAQRDAEAPSADDSTDLAGPDLARAVLDAALTKRREAARNPRRRRGADESGRRLRGYSGPGPDPRDPQPFGAVLDRLMKARGWEKPKAEATVFGAWERVVGPDIAKHSRPVKLDAGVLTVEAESTAWATQLRLLAAGLLKNIAGEVGHNVVTRLQIHGPAAPSWSKGPRRVQGRGPRDTYG